jgi:hypothetical protein
MVHLHGRTIRFDSAQHVLMLVITRQSDGFVFKIVPLQSVEVSDVRLVTRQRITPEDVNRMEGTAARQIDVATAFPGVEALTLSELPSAYKIVPSDAMQGFQFDPGALYIVSIVSSSVSEFIVTAD